MWQCGRFRFDRRKPLVMGIVNATPDSFSDGGRSLAQLIDHAFQLYEEGADLLDIGGESTRPGATPVPASVEIERILPLISALRDLPIPVSVDTFKPEVMAQALDAGADMINDITACRDPASIPVLKAFPDAGLCIMHMSGEPQTMQLQVPDYEGNVCQAVYQYFQQRLMQLQAQGIAAGRMCIDPGFGFGKSLRHNYNLLAHLSHFASLDCPLLVGISRKSMIGAVTQRPVGERLPGSLAAATLALQQGAFILRVHDVSATKDVVAVVQATQHCPQE